MSSVQEFEGKNLEKAIEKACNELKITEEKLKYDIISYGSSGIFGLVGAKKAKIKVRLEPRNLEGAPEKSPVQEEIVKVQEEKPQVTEMVEDALLEEAAAFGEEALKEILKTMVEDAVIRFEMKDREIKYHVTSEKSALLIGKRGQTLEAVQYILEKIINKNRNPKVHVRVDIEGYLESRKESLEEMAIKFAEKAKKTGKPVAVGNMNANDRKIIHLTLKNDRKVRTQSMGDGILKKLVIFPRKKSSPKSKALTEETE
jgi:spoIIIJ-associated protein